jgi:hypothetical protein
VSLARGQVDRERAGLLRIWADAPQDARSVSRLGGRLIGLFRDEAWAEQALDRLALRLRRLVRLFSDMQNVPEARLRKAVAETSVEALGNPFRPMDSPRMAALLAKPAAERQAGQQQGHRVLPELPAEEPEPEESSQSARRQQDSGNDGAKTPDSEAAMRNTKPETHARSRRGPAAAHPQQDWPGNFEAYQALVERSLGAGEELAPLVERIARLSWERHALLEQEPMRVVRAIKLSLFLCSPRMPAHQVVDFVLEMVRGEDFRQAQSRAQQLESELAAALDEYLERRYGVQSAGSHDEPASEPLGPGHEPRTTHPVPELASAPQRANPEPRTPNPVSGLASEPQDANHEPRTTNPVSRSSPSPKPASGNMDRPETGIIGCGRPICADVPDVPLSPSKIL